MTQLRLNLVLAMMAAFASAPAAAQQASGCDSLAGIPIEPAVDWRGDIKPIINELISPMGRCTSCHNAAESAGGLDLSDNTFDAIYKIVDNTPGSYVVPGRPQDSLLFLKINCQRPPQGLRMPLAQAPLSLAQQALIYDWIAQGAKGEPEDPIFRLFIGRDGFESQHF